MNSRLEFDGAADCANQFMLFRGAEQVKEVLIPPDVLRAEIRLERYPREDH